MEILLNGKSKIITSPLTVEKLLEDLKINPGGVVVELNLDILAKDKYRSAQLKDKDQVEIVHFMGGG